MSRKSLPIAVGGALRLRASVEETIRRAHADELSRATDSAEREAIEKQIRREIEEEMKRVSSPYSLW